MPKADMPDPPGGELTCPKDTVPWVEKDIGTGEINAECKPDKGARTPTEYKNLIWSYLPRYQRDEIDIESQSFLDMMNSGKIETTAKIYTFPRLSDFTGDSGIASGL